MDTRRSSSNLVTNDTHIPLILQTFQTLPSPCFHITQEIYLPHTEKKNLTLLTRVNKANMIRKSLKAKIYDNSPYDERAGYLTLFAQRPAS